MCRRKRSRPRERFIGKAHHGPDARLASAGCTRKRTTFVLNIIIGMPICKRGFQPFVLHPIPYPADVIQKMTTGAGVTRIETHVHPIHVDFRSGLDNSLSAFFGTFGTGPSDLIQYNGQSELSRYVRLCPLLQGPSNFDMRA